MIFKKMVFCPKIIFNNLLNLLLYNHFSKLFFKYQIILRKCFSFENHFKEYQTFLKNHFLIP